MDFAAIQSRGDAAYDATLLRGGSSYDAAVAYQATVMTLRQEETDSELNWLCPICNKVDTPVGMACGCYVQDEHDVHADRRAQAKARDGQAEEIQA